LLGGKITCQGRKGSSRLFLVASLQTAWEFLMVVEASCSCGTRFDAQAGLTAIVLLSRCSKPLGNFWSLADSLCSCGTRFGAQVGLTAL